MSSVITDRQPSTSSRRSTIWHSMPDGVRRSSVQSRRASLTAGRRMSAHNANIADWDIEAPPTPDENAAYAARATREYEEKQQRHVEEAETHEYPTEETNAATAAAAAPSHEEQQQPAAEEHVYERAIAEEPVQQEEAVAQHEAEVAEPVEHESNEVKVAETAAEEPQETQQEEEEAREYPTEEADTVAAVAAQQEDEAEAAPQQQQQEQEQERAIEQVEEKNGEQPVAEEAPKEVAKESVTRDSKRDSKRRSSKTRESKTAAPTGPVKKRRTRHLIRFRGNKWDDLLHSNEQELRETVLEDVKDATSLTDKELRELELTVNNGNLMASFYVQTKCDDETARKYHLSLREYAFPKTSALYVQEELEKDADEL